MNLMFVKFVKNLIIVNGHNCVGSSFKRQMDKFNLKTNRTPNLKHTWQPNSNRIFLNQHHWRKHQIKRWTHDHIYSCMVIVSCQPTGLYEGTGQPIPEVHRRFSNLDPDCNVPAFTPTANLNKLTEAWFKPHLWPSPVYTSQTFFKCCFKWRTLVLVAYGQHQRYQTA